MKGETTVRASVFWKYVFKGKPNRCWLWIGRKSKDGYGQYGRLRAHRVAFALTNGEALGVIRHTCDRPLCCNPNHLQAGSHRYNVIDRVTRGRSASAKNGQWRGGRPRGQLRVKPTPQQAIRKSERIAYWKEYFRKYNDL